MTGSRVPVLWISGPAGVGKSTVSWQLFTELADSGTRVAFADADQLCMCYPPPPDDPGRDRIRARNAGAVIGNYQAAGARCVIVNGVVDPALGVQPDLIGPATVTVCRLRADRDEVVRRFSRRYQRSGGDLGDAVRQVRDECDRMDTSGFADVCVDTTGVPAVEAARLVRDSCRDWPGFREVVREPPGAAPAAADAQALDRTHLDAIRIDTDGHTAVEAAGLIAAATRWPGQLLTSSAGGEEGCRSPFPSWPSRRSRACGCSTALRSSSVTAE